MRGRHSVPALVADRFAGWRHIERRVQRRHDALEHPVTTRPELVKLAARAAIRDRVPHPPCRRVRRLVDVASPQGSLRVKDVIRRFGRIGHQAHLRCWVSIRADPCSRGRTRPTQDPPHRHPAGKDSAYVREPFTLALQPVADRAGSSISPPRVGRLTDPPQTVQHLRSPTRRRVSRPAATIRFDASACLGRRAAVAGHVPLELSQGSSISTLATYAVPRTARMRSGSSTRLSR